MIPAVHQDHCAGFEPGTSASEVWCATIESPHLRSTCNLCNVLLFSEFLCPVLYTVWKWSLTKLMTTERILGKIVKNICRWSTMIFTQDTKRKMGAAPQWRKRCQKLHTVIFLHCLQLTITHFMCKNFFFMKTNLKTLKYSFPRSRRFKHYSYLARSQRRQINDALILTRNYVDALKCPKNDVL